MIATISLIFQDVKGHSEFTVPMCNRQQGRKRLAGVRKGSENSCSPDKREQQP